MKKRISNLLGLYFKYNLFYYLITFIIFKKYNLLLGTQLDIKSFFLSPITHGHQYHLFLSAWFVVTIFFVQVIFLYLFMGMKTITKNKYIHLFVFFLFGLGGTLLAAKGHNTGTLLPVVKILFSLPFFYGGLFFKKYIEKINIYRSETILGVFVIQMMLAWHYNNSGDLSGYALSWGNFNGHLLSPFILSINGIVLYLFISKALSKVLKPNDLLVKLGENSFHIMANHLFVFFIINYLFSKRFEINMGQINVWYSYELDKYWFIYVVLGLLVPTYSAILFRKGKAFLDIFFLAKEKKLDKGIQNTK
ncbi:hypothetical protein V7087_04415 [Neobacillus niacini]|uniref:hypothetical protein n=1 Tax=Neobacillus niacini TaxID=86668 RepID=UPI003000F0F5